MASGVWPVTFASLGLALARRSGYLNFWATWWSPTSFLVDGRGRIVSREVLREPVPVTTRPQGIR